MIVTDRMIFLHLHKSGGTFVNALLMRCVPSARRNGYHYPYREIAAVYRHLPVLGTVRNPWAYYVSWYHFQARMRQPNILFQICSDAGDLDFNSTVANLANLSGDDRRLELLEEGLPEDYEAAGLNLIKRDVADLRAWGEGFYSFLYQRLYAGTSAPVIMRMERLREELRPALEAVGHLPNDCISEFLTQAPPLNVTPHEAPEHYFGGDLAALVADRERLVVDRYGYALGSS